MTLTRQQLNAIVDFALSGTRVHPTIRLAVAVVDASGHTLLATREPDAPALLIDIAQSKAKSCVAIGMPTRAIMDLAQKNPPGSEARLESHKVQLGRRFGARLVEL